MGALTARRATAAGLRPVLGGRRAEGVAAQACIRASAHYLDLAGEVPEYEALLVRDAEARAAGVMLMPGVGFGIVPTDCVAVHLKGRMPDAVRLELSFQAVGGVTRGTATNIFTGLHKPGVERRDGELVAVLPAEREHGLDLGAGRTIVFTNPWRADQTTAYRSTGIPNIEAYTALPPPVRLVMRSSRRAGRVFASRPWQALLRRAIRLMPEGPSEKQLAKGTSYVFGASRERDRRAGRGAPARPGGQPLHRAHGGRGGPSRAGGHGAARLPDTGRRVRAAARARRRRRADRHRLEATATAGLCSVRAVREAVARARHALPEPSSRRTRGSSSRRPRARSWPSWRMID